MMNTQVSAAQESAAQDDAVALQEDIPFEDEHGRRIDVHSLRKTFGTMLAVNGVPVRVCMELMRHSESRLTEKVYTDASHLPLQPAVNALPALQMPK